MKPYSLVENARTLRSFGLTYRQVGIQLGISTPKAWILCNLKRHNEATRESVRRYRARDSVALCDMKEPRS